MSNNDQQTESDTEDILVYAEFQDNVNIEKYRSIHVLGIDSDNPIIQVDDNFFKGEYENPLGTFMFFEEDPTIKCSDPLFDKLPEKNLKYLFKTRKFLKTEHAYVAPKEGTEADVHAQPEEEPKAEIEVNFKTLEEAIKAYRINIIPKANQSTQKQFK